MIEIIKIETELNASDEEEITKVHYHIWEGEEKRYGRLDLDDPITFTDQTEDEIIALIKDHEQIKTSQDTLHAKVLKGQNRERRLRAEVEENSETKIKFRKPDWAKSR